MSTESTEKDPKEVHDTDEGQGEESNDESSGGGTQTTNDPVSTEPGQNSSPPDDPGTGGK